MKEKEIVELHVVIDDTGIQAIRIYGEPGVESKGVELYKKIKDLLPRWHKEIQERLKNEKLEHELNFN